VRRDRWLNTEPNPVRLGRYEWLWRFDRDADMSSVHANYEDGVLRVTVRRIPGYRLGETC
jgi:HSP20 family molecular chaperone IbpA